MPKYDTFGFEPIKKSPEYVEAKRKLANKFRSKKRARGRLLSGYASTTKKRKARISQSLPPVTAGSGFESRSDGAKDI